MKNERCVIIQEENVLVYQLPFVLSNDTLNIKMQKIISAAVTENLSSGGSSST